MRNFRSTELPYPSPKTQKAGVMPSIPEPSNEGFAKPTELKQKTVDLPGKKVRTKGTGAATFDRDWETDTEVP